jgi:N4-gp56 family major capsid protein
MSATFAVGDANAVKLWSKGVQVAVREKAEIGKLMGKSADSIVQIKTETSKGKGDTIKFNLRAPLNGDGFTEGQRGTGNGENLTFHQASVIINELGHIAQPTSEFTIDAQRVPFEPRDEGRDALVEWFAKRISVTAFNHWCGYLPANSAPYGVKYTGNNTVVAHSSTRKVWATASVTADESLGSSDKANLNMIDRAKTLAALGDNQLRPAMVGGQPKFLSYFHPQQIEDITTNTTTGQWFSIQQAALQGGLITKNPIFTGAIGDYKGVIMRQTQDVTLGVNSSTGVSVANVRRAVMLGAQAGVCAYTSRGNPGQGKYRWTEKYDDHDRVLEMGSWTIWGFVKPQFNSVDQGTITMSSYSSQ